MGFRYKYWQQAVTNIYNGARRNDRALCYSPLRAHVTNGISLQILETSRNTYFLTGLAVTAMRFATARYDRL